MEHHKDYSKEFFQELVNFWEKGIRELKSEDFDDGKIKYELGQAIAHLSKANQLYQWSNVEIPESCGNPFCDKTPKYPKNRPRFCKGCYEMKAD